MPASAIHNVLGRSIDEGRDGRLRIRLPGINDDGSEEDDMRLVLRRLGRWVTTDRRRRASVYPTGRTFCDGNSGEEILGGAPAVYSFGDNSMGALGLPSPLYDAYEPTQIPLHPSHGVISSIAAGHYHSLAVTSSGEVWSWGRNDEGQLGRGPSSTRDTWHEPRRVEGLEHVKVRAAFASGVVSAAVGEDGSLWVWGRSKRGQLGLGSGVIEAINPTKIRALEGEEIVKVSFGWGHALAQTSGGELIGWGNAADGGLGAILGQEEDDADIRDPSLPIAEAVKRAVLARMEKEKNMPIVWEPRKLQELEDRRVRDLACGLDHSLVLCRDGMVLSCGRNTYGQLGRAGEEFRLLPAVLPFPPDSVAAGLGHCLALSRVSSEGIVSWGWNDSSQLGREGEGERPGMVNGVNGEKIASISCGRVHSIAVSNGGKLWAWGSGKNGRLGLGSSASEPEPACVDSLEGLRVLHGVCGFDHTLLLVAA